MAITDTPGTTLEKVSMDIAGPLPGTQKWNEYILANLDNFTNYSQTILLSNFLASTIADAFAKKSICIFGSPKSVLTDQGIKISSNLIRKLAKRFRICQIRKQIFIDNQVDL